MEEGSIYRSGDIFLPKDIVKKLDRYIIGDKESLFYINGWSIMHFFSGVLIRLIFKTDIKDAIMLHTIWEIWQIIIGMSDVREFWKIKDIIMDTLVFYIGVLSLTE